MYVFSTHNNVNAMFHWLHKTLPLQKSFWNPIANVISWDKTALEDLVDQTLFKRSVIFACIHPIIYKHVYVSIGIEYQQLYEYSWHNFPVVYVDSKNCIESHIVTAVTSSHSRPIPLDNVGRLVSTLANRWAHLGSFPATRNLDLHRCHNYMCLLPLATNRDFFPLT